MELSFCQVQSIRSFVFIMLFRRDIAEIDSTALNIARDGGNLSPVLDRLHIMDEILGLPR